MTTDLDTRRKRALWRASHRGTKEMDWMLGKFAAARVSQMSESQLAELEQLMALPEPDLQAWLLAPEPPHGLEFARLVAEVRAFHGMTGSRSVNPGRD